MEPPKAEESVRLPRWRIYGWCIMLLVGLSLCLVILFQHRSIDAVILGRYSVTFSLFLAVVLVTFVGAGVFVAVQGRRLPEACAAMAARGARAPGFLTTLVVGGGFFVVIVALFHELVAAFLPGPAFAVSMAVTYAGVVGLLFSALGRRRAASLKQPMLLMGLGLALGLALGEVGLRVVARFTPYRILAPNMHKEFRPAPEILPGITGISVYTTNTDGIRGDPYTPESRYTMLAIGGSTTQCAYLDDTEAWPHFLQEQLNQLKQPGGPLWVGNVGRSAHGIVEHIYTLRHFVPQYEFDAVIMMIGINDLSWALWRLGNADALVEETNDARHHFHRSFYQWPLVDGAVSRPFPQNVALWMLIEQSFRRLFQPSFNDLQVEDLAAHNYDGRRRRRQKARGEIDELPDLAASLDAYEQDVLTAIRIARGHDLRLILTTQPVLWREGLSDPAERLLWFGLKDSAGHYRYTAGALARAMDLFNARVLDICRATNTECVDLAAAMNGDERYFYDDVHFNELGAQTVAKLLADYLKPPE